MFDADFYAVNYATVLSCLRDSSYVLADDVVFSKDELNDLLSTALCDQLFALSSSFLHLVPFLSASLYFSKKSAY